MMPVLEVVVIVTAARSLRLLSTNKGKVRDANPCEKVMLWQEDTSRKVVGSNPGAGKDFSHKISVKVNL